MDEKVQIVTEGLREMIQPYLGRREYGDLCIVGSKKELPNWNIGPNIGWFLNYELISGSSSGISAHFLPEEGVFTYLRHPDFAKIRTENPEEVLNHFRQRFDFIQPQRREHLMKNAKLQKERNVPLEKAVAGMREFAQKAQRFGPTEDELKLYEQFCYEVYSTK